MLNTIRCPRLVKFSANSSAPIVVLDAGIHAREWVAVGATSAFIHRMYFYSLLGKQVGGCYRRVYVSYMDLLNVADTIFFLLLIDVGSLVVG